MNLTAALLAAAQSAPERLALAGPEPTTYAQLATRAASVAAEVAGRTRSGERVVIVAGNEAAFVAAYLGTLGAGAVAVPLNVGSPSHDATANSQCREKFRRWCVCGLSVYRFRQPNAARCP